MRTIQPLCFVLGIVLFGLTAARHASLAATSQPVEKAAPPPRTEFSPPLPPRLIVPADASAPTIGSFDDSQWADSAVLCGLNDAAKGVLSEKSFVAHLKSDGTKLYLAICSDVIDPGSDASTNQNSWQIFVYPNASSRDYFMALVDAKGTVSGFDQKQLAWNGRWEIKQRVEQQKWKIEASIPLEDFGAKADIDGVQWKVGLCINQNGAETRTYTWDPLREDRDAPQEFYQSTTGRSFSWVPLIGLYEQFDHMATVTFKKDASVVGLSSLGHPTAGLISPELSCTKSNLSAAAILTDAGGHETRKIITMPNKACEFAPLTGSGKAKLVIISPADAAPETADFSYSAIIPYDSNPLTVRTTNYPSRQEVCLDLNYSSLPQANEVKSYAIDLGDGEQQVARESNSPSERICISTKHLTPGQRTCTASLIASAGKNILSRQFSYIKDGAEPWLHNTVGIQRGYVPPPYTPIQVRGNSVEVIGRKITYTDTGLPREIVSAGVNLLHEPVHMDGEFDGQASSLQAKSTFAIADAQPDDSVGSATVKLGPLVGTLRQTISFDGLCWYEIQISSPNKTRAKNVSIEIPLNADAAQYYYLTEPDYKMLGLEDKEWEVSDVLRHDMDLPFGPGVYLGNDTAGLAWVAETEKGWQIAHDKKTIEIQKRGDAVILKINLVDDAIDLSELNIAFGLQATPMKPITERQKLMTITPGTWPEWPANIQAYGVYQGQDPSDAAKVVSFAGLPEPQNPELAHRVTGAQKKVEGRYFTPYCELNWLSLGLPEMQIYGGDWSLNKPWAGTAGSAADPQPFSLCDLENQDYQDFIVWRFVKNWGAYDGSSIYVDLFSPTWPDKFPEHRRGYLTRSGRIAYPWPIHAFRNIVRRLYIGYKQKNPNFAIFTHASNLHIPLVAFGDAWLIGESFSGAPTRYPEILPYDRYRAWFYGYPMGLKTFFMPSLKSPDLVAKTELTNYLIGVVFNHNTTFWTVFVNQPIMLPFIRRYHGEGWPLQQFLPYWKYPDLTTLPPDKFKVSGWYNAKEKKGLLMVASLSASPISTPISIGKGWTFSNSPKLTNPIPASEYGDYPIPATFDGTTAVFKPYGVLMLEVQ